MNTPVVYSSRARQDMLDIWLWVAESSGEQAADRVLDRIEERIAQLGTFPEMGPTRPEIADTARVLVVLRWLALYRIADRDIRIARIIDGAMDVERLEFSD